MEESICSRIRSLINYYNISDRQFAIHIGVNQSVVASMFSRGTEPSAKILTSILDKCPEISAEWLMRGKGEMIIGSEQPNTSVETTPISDRESALIDTIAMQQETIHSLKDKVKTLEAELIIANSRNRIV
jgi:Zn-finger nucleic acid-binding protein